MISWRFFVTNVLLLVTAAFLACTSKTEKRTAEVNEGNRQIKVAARAQTSLANTFSVDLSAGRPFDWSRISKEERHQIKGKLVEFVNALSRVFDLDERKGIYITQRELLQKQISTALGLLKSLDQFERVYGENFDPRNPKDRA